VGVLSSLKSLAYSTTPSGVVNSSESCVHDAMLHPYELNLDIRGEGYTFLQVLEVLLRS